MKRTRVAPHRGHEVVHLGLHSLHQPPSLLSVVHAPECHPHQPVVLRRYSDALHLLDDIELGGNPCASSAPAVAAAMHTATGSLAVVFLDGTVVVWYIYTDASAGDRLGALRVAVVPPDPRSVGPCRAPRRRLAVTSSPAPRRLRLLQL